MDSVLIIHIGAGRHSVKFSPKYRKLLRAALRNNDIISASRTVEKSYLTNTGYGSSLDRSGNVTSDACIIYCVDGRIVNSLTLVNVDNSVSPTARVDSVLKQMNIEYAEENVNRKFGLSKPAVLDHRAFSSYTKSIRNRVEYESNLGDEGGCNTKMVPDRARADYKKFEALFETGKNSAKLKRDINVVKWDPEESETDRSRCLASLKRQKVSKDSLISTPHSVEDTVGYIELSRRKLRIASSSGGNFYRLPGRLSCAGIPGAGTSYTSLDNIEVCCMCSGNGDDIITMSLASYLCNTMAEKLAESEDWPDLGPLLVSRIKRKSIRTKKTAVNAQLEEIAYVGVIMVIRTPTVKRLVFCHSTESFYFAFRANGKIETVLSRSNVPAGDFLHGEYKV